MAERKDDRITRKEFIRKSSAGLVALGLLGGEAGGRGDDEEDPPPPAPPETPAKPRADFRTLGRTKIRVSTICYGASRTMEPGLVKSALDRGINFLDTGRSYFGGRNEEMVGKVIRRMRDEVVIQSKVSLRLRGKEKSPDLAALIERTMRASLEKSLKALKTDYIDVLLLHGASSVEIMHHETVKAFFSEARKKGLIRAYGFSSHTNQVALVEAAAADPFHDVIMVPYNHKGSFVHSRSGHYSEWKQPALEKAIVKARKKGVAFVAMKTCSGGPHGKEGEEPSFRSAVKWVLDRDFISSAAVAMGNAKELDEDIPWIASAEGGE